MLTEKTYVWNIVSKIQETHNTWTFFLKSTDEKPDFVAGQYLTVKIPDHTPLEGKAYSISSAPHHDHVSITVKDIGEYSKKILNYNEGDMLATSAPYGFFYPESDDTDDLVFLVGGIGITPCISIIENLIHKKSGRGIHLHYSNQTTADILFLNRIIEFEKQNNTLSVNLYITRETNNDHSFIYNRMDIKKIVSSIQKNPEFFLCGSMQFTKEIWKELNKAKILQEKIYTEGFF